MNPRGLQTNNLGTCNDNDNEEHCILINLSFSRMVSKWVLILGWLPGEKSGTYFKTLNFI